MKWSEEQEKQPGQLELDTLYPFECVEAEEGQWDDGMPFMSLKLRVFVDDTERTLYDRLQPSFAKKFKSFFESQGMLSKYRSQSLDETDCIGSTGYIRTSKKNSKKGYPMVDVYLTKQQALAMSKGDDMQERVGVTNPGTGGSIARMQQSDDDMPF